MQTEIITTFAALLDAESALARLAAARLPYAAAYRVAKLTKAIAGELEHFHKERNALVEEFGTTRDSTAEERARGAGATVSEVRPTSPDWPTFLARATELATVEVRIPLAPLDPATIPDLSITAADLLALAPLLVDGTPGG